MLSQRIVWSVMLSAVLLAGFALPVSAQQGEAGDAPAVSRPVETPDHLPHGKFLLDYVLVLALFAAALYSVGRSSRRR